MQFYESVLIIKSELGDAKIAEKVAEVEELIKKNDGSVIKVENWGKKRLAYKVKKLRNGVYVLVTYKLLPSMSSKVTRALILKDEIIKFITLQISEAEANAERKEVTSELQPA